MTRLLILALLLAQAALARTIMIVVPHQDDETWSYAGVIYEAALAGDRVILVMMLDGVADGAQLSLGATREGESVAAMAVAGVPEAQVLFLGYPAQHLHDIYDLADADALYTSPAPVRTATHASHGLGGTDWHSYRAGSPASYTKNNVIADLQAAIRAYRPEVIYAEYGEQLTADHGAVGLFVTAALDAGVSYSPYVYSAVTYDRERSWPHLATDVHLGSDLAAYLAYEHEPNMLGWDIAWAGRINHVPPAAMLSTDPAVNVKVLMLNCYESQSAHLEANREWWWATVRASTPYWVTRAGAYRNVIGGGTLGR